MRSSRSLVTLLIASLFATPAAAADVATLLAPAAGKVLYVTPDGNNKNPGTQKEAPLKNIDKALKVAAAGDTIAVAEGTYMGTFGIGYLETDKPVKLYGGFSKDFTERDPMAHPTLFQPDNKSGAKSRKALVTFKKDIDGTVVDGFVFDMGMRNSYDPAKGKPEGVTTGMLLLPPKKAPGQVPTVSESCIDIPSAAKEGSLTIENNIFANCASYGIQGGQRGGKWVVRNNVFVANRMAAAEIFGTCRSKTPGPAGAKEPCGDLEFAHNTVLFSWSRIEDFQDMGYGFRVMTKLRYDIHHNIFGGNVTGGVDSTRFNPGENIKMDHNIFFANKRSDLFYSPASNTQLELAPDQFGDLDFASAEGNKTEIPKSVQVDKAYLEGFLGARYSEEQDYDPNSAANLWREAMGLNKQGKLKTSVTMFGNRYPWESAAKLVGALDGFGAQKLK